MTSNATFNDTIQYNGYLVVNASKIKGDVIEEINSLIEHSSYNTKIKVMINMLWREQRDQRAKEVKPMLFCT